MITDLPSGDILYPASPALIRFATSGFEAFTAAITALLSSSVKVVALVTGTVGGVTARNLSFN